MWTKKILEAVVEDEMGGEFSHFADDEEFENFPDKSEVGRETEFQNKPWYLSVSLKYILG